VSGAGARIGANVVALIVARVAGLAFTLVQSSLIFRALGVEGTGQFGFAQGFASLFSVFAILGLHRLLIRDISREPAIAWTYVWSALVVVAGLSAVVLVALTGLAALLGEAPFVVMAVGAAGLSVVALWAIQQPFESMLIAHERMGVLSLVHIAQAALKLGAIVVLMIYVRQEGTPLAEWGYGAALCHGVIALGNLAAFALCVAAAVRVAGWRRPHFDFAFIVPRMRECFPYTLSMIFSLLYFKSDMTLLQLLEGDLATGVYTPAQRVMEPAFMIAGLWGTAIFPALCRVSHTSVEEYGRLKATSARLALIGAFPMGAGLALLAEPIVGILTGDTVAYADTVVLLQWLAAIIPLFYLNTVGQEFLYSAHRNWFVTWAYAAAAAVAVTGNLLLIPVLGVMAVAWVALAANGVISALFVYGLHRELGGMQLPTLLAKIAVACAVMAATALVVAQWNLFLGALVGAVAYGVMVLLLRTFNDLEQTMIAQTLAPLLQRIRPPTEQ